MRAHAADWSLILRDAPSTAWTGTLRLICTLSLLFPCVDSLEDVELLVLDVLSFRKGFEVILLEVRFLCAYCSLDSWPYLFNLSEVL